MTTKKNIKSGDLLVETFWCDTSLSRNVEFCQALFSDKHFERQVFNPEIFLIEISRYSITLDSGVLTDFSLISTEKEKFNFPGTSLMFIMSNGICTSTSTYIENSAFRAFARGVTVNQREVKEKNMIVFTDVRATLDLMLSPPEIKRIYDSLELMRI